jgi:hypothetical protein
MYQTTNKETKKAQNTHTTEKTASPHTSKEEETQKEDNQNVKKLVGHVQHVTRHTSHVTRHTSHVPADVLSLSSLLSASSLLSFSVSLSGGDCSLSSSVLDTKSTTKGEGEGEEGEREREGEGVAAWSKRDLFLLFFGRQPGNVAQQREDQPKVSGS